LVKGLLVFKTEISNHLNRNQNIYIALGRKNAVGIMNQNTESRDKEIKETNENKDIVFGEFSVKSFFLDTVSLFLITISLFLVTGLLWELTYYILENSDQIIELSLGDIFKTAINYQNYIYPMRIIFYTLLFFAFLIGLYLVIGFFKHIIGKKRDNRKFNTKIGKKRCIKRLFLIICIFSLIIILCCVFQSPLRKDLLEQNKSKVTNIILSVLFAYWVIQIPGKLNHLNLFRNIKEYMQENRWSMGLFIYSVIFYHIICFFFTETQETQTGNYFGIFILPGIAIVISMGFFVCATMLQKIVGINRGILGFLDINIGKKQDQIIEDIKKHIKSFLANFLVAISSYIFLKTILNIIPSEKFVLSNVLDFLEHNLSIIFLVPLYLFFYKAVSSILENIYEKVYDICEKPTGLNPVEDGKNYVVSTFVGITKFLIVIFIILSIISRFVGLEEKLGFLFEPPMSYIIGTGIAVPITLWFLVLILDPFFEGETIEINSHRGKIKKVGFFFTNLETMIGEQIYIPNAELLAKTIRRLHARNPPEKREKEDKYEPEKGMMIYFSCTLSYAYNPKEIEKEFVNLFKEDGIEEFKTYIKDADFEIPDREIKYIFSKEKSHPFVFIEEFKDYGVSYRFNFRARDSLLAPVLRGYFMKIFKNKMDENCKPIITPVKFEIKDIGEKEFRF
jgi:hypothetical protein